MENTQNSTSSIENTTIAAEATAQVQTETKAKRAYHRLTVEEKAQRDAEYAAYKEGVAQRKAERAAKKAERDAKEVERKAAIAAKKEASKERRAQAEAYKAERRLVELDLSVLASAVDAFKSDSTGSVKDFRLKLAQVMNAAQNLDKAMFHRSPKTTVTIKA